MEESQFVARIQEKDPEAIQEVVHRYLPQILRAARGSGLDPQSAEDVAQSTFLTFVESAHRFEGRSHVRTWLFGILYKKISETRRRVRRDEDTDDIDQVFEQRFDADGSWSRPPRPVDAGIYDQELRREIASCLDQVSTKQRMAFVLREVEEMSTEEICNVLEVTRTNLGVLLLRARNRLRECLESKGVAGE
jgi:RNA polymerase sigma-70 factor (ECF subfamily)